MSSHDSYPRSIEYKRRAAGALGTIGLALLPTACLDTGPETPPSVSTTEAPKKRPIDANYLAAPVQALAVPVAPGSAELTFPVDALPPNYNQAFHTAVQNPIVGLGISTGKISSIELRATEFDNGYFEANTNQLRLAVSGAPATEGGIFTHDKIMEWTLMHEAFHALNKQWYTDLVNNTHANDPAYNQKLTKLQQTCTTLRTDVLEDFIAINRDILAQSMIELSKQRVEEASSRPKRDLHVLARLGTLIQQNDPAIYQLPFVQEEVACAPPQLTDISEMITGSAYTNFSSGLSPSMVTLYDQDAQLGSKAEDLFDCIKDGTNMKHALGLAHTPSAGHAWSNLNEAASSVELSLAIAPAEVSTCLDAMPAEAGANLKNLLGAILDVSFYTNNQLRELLSQDPTARELIDSLVPVR